MKLKSYAGEDLSRSAHTSLTIARWEETEGDGSQFRRPSVAKRQLAEVVLRRGETGCDVARIVRDREAPGSNPGPPTTSLEYTCVVLGRLKTTSCSN